MRDADRAAAVRRVFDRSGHHTEDVHDLWTTTVLTAALENKTKLNRWEVYPDE